MVWPFQELNELTLFYIALFRVASRDVPSLFVRYACICSSAVNSFYVIKLTYLRVATIGPGPFKDLPHLCFHVAFL